MIKLDAIINIASQSSGSIYSATNMEIGGSTNAEINGDLSGVINTEKSEVPYVGEQTCDNNGIFERSNLITINGKDMLSVSVAFDTTNNQHPKTLYSSNFVDKKIITVEVEGEQTSNGYRFWEYIDIDEPLISVTSVKRYKLAPMTTTYPITVVSSTIKASANNQVFLYDILTGASKVRYEIEIEVLSSENLKTINITSPIVDVGIGKTTDRIMFIVNDWNTPNSKMVISGIYLPSRVTYNVDSRHISSISTKTIDREDIAFPSYGVVSNSGKLEFIDYNYMIQKYITEGTFTNDTYADIYISNTITNRKIKINSLYAKKWSYDFDTLSVKVDLSDGLEEWQDIPFDGLALSTQKTLLEIYEYIKSKTPSKFKFAELDNDTMTFMQSVKCSMPYIESGSLWSAYDKVAKIGALHIYKNNGEIITKHLF